MRGWEAAAGELMRLLALARHRLRWLDVFGDRPPYLLLARRIVRLDAANPPNRLALIGVQSHFAVIQPISD